MKRQSKSMTEVARSRVPGNGYPVCPLSSILKHIYIQNSILNEGLVKQAVF